MRGTILGLALVVASACATPKARPVYPAWPFGAPRVKLERVVKSVEDLDRAYVSPFRESREKPLFLRPYDVTLVDEALYVTDPGASRVVGIEGFRRVRHSAADLFATPIGIASCGDAIVVSDAAKGEVVLLGRDLGLRAKLATNLYRPTGVACVGSALVVVETGRHRLLKFTEMGATGVSDTFGHRGAGPDALNYPAAISAGGDCLWVGDTLNFRLLCLDPETLAVAGTFGRLGDSRGETPRVKGIAVDAAGHIWVSDALLDTVSLYTDGGDFLLSLGGYGSEPGKFSFPAGISAAPDGRVVVVDSLNRRLQQFRLVESKDAES